MGPGFPHPARTARRARAAMASKSVIGWGVVAWLACSRAAAAA